MKKEVRLRYFLILLFLLFVAGGAFAIEDYPAQYRTTTNLNVRSYPSQSSYKIGTLSQYSYVTVKYTVGSSYDTWGVIQYGERDGFISMRYVERVEPAPESQPEVQQEEQYSSQPNNGIFRKISRGFESFFKGLWTLIKWGFIIIGGSLLLAYGEQIFQAVIFIAVFMGAGALLFWLLFDNSSWGASIGFIVGVLVGLRLFLSSIDSNVFQLFLVAYWLITIPSWICNRLQFILTAPWRYLFKYTIIDDSLREVLRPFLYFVQILLYIVTTPLRLINAIYYNIFVYGITELYDLTCEVFIPSNYSEGRGDLWNWIKFFPVRLVRYPIFHGSLTLIEGAVWTVVDIFIPTITMYHGTNFDAANAILGSSERNKNLGNKWFSGTFVASNNKNAWGGMGVYFTPSRHIAIEYCNRAGGTVFIACRVSLGSILNYSLAPRYVEGNTGKFGRPSVLNKYAETNGYDTAEWWNGEYWEYCMFDWQNRYNYPWRIRPIYAFNIGTGLAQHIDGGIRHWLFSKMVLDDILDSVWLTSLVTSGFIITIWFLCWLLF